MIALLISISIAQVPSLPYADLIEDRARLITFQAGVTALNEDAELLGDHRGLVEYLDAHPSLSLSEQAYREPMRLPTFRDLTGAFEESLRENEMARKEFNDFYYALSTDDAISSRIDALNRMQLRDPASYQAIAYLKAHPQDARTFLDNPLHLLPTPEELYPLRNRFRADRDLQSELRTIFAELHDSAAVHAYVFPWWKTALAETSEESMAYQALSAHFSRYAQRYWVWHRRNAAWTLHPRERDWLSHHYASVRRNPALRNTYFELLALLREQPALDEMLTKAWRDEHGEPAAWPPDGDPPNLPPLPPSDSLQRPEAPDAPSGPAINRPERPTRANGNIQIPTRPSRPDTPSENQLDLDFE